MGCKAEGAAQGYTILGGIVLLIYAIQRIINNINLNGPNTGESIIQIIFGIVIIVLVILAFDACGFVDWKVAKSGILLAIFGLMLLVLVLWPFVNFDVIAWLMRLDTLASLMILLGGILLLWSK